MSAIPRNWALDPKIIDDELIMEHLNDRFITNLGASYGDRMQVCLYSNLKSVEDYTKALRIVHDQEPMQAYLSNHAIPIIADWPDQFFIRKAIVHQLTAFLPIMGSLHVMCL
ncbi:21947_t:CDS:2 [Entrophospora sp. SA101]|nr:4226_t:CDS:2 [Entrophospora sp. SA101]CAJ0764808.1 21947_t:CDS:2 [Entrophospora sp. SA101]